MRKKYLKDKFIEFQRKIAELSNSLNKQRDTFLAKDKELFLELFEILDAFENLFDNIKDKEAELDKPAKMLIKNNRSIYKKLLRFMKSRNIVKLEFSENKAKIGYCKIIDTLKDQGKENETIVSIIRDGYINNSENVVLRPAEVITVLN